MFFAKKLSYLLSSLINASDSVSVYLTITCRVNHSSIYLNGFVQMFSEEMQGIISARIVPMGEQESYTSQEIPHFLPSVNSTCCQHEKSGRLLSNYFIKYDSWGGGLTILTSFLFFFLLLKKVGTVHLTYLYIIALFIPLIHGTMCNYMSLKIH